MKITSAERILWSASSIPFNKSPTCLGERKGGTSKKLDLSTASSTDSMGGSRFSMS